MIKTNEERYKDVIVAGLEILNLRKEIKARIETIRSNLTVEEYEDIEFDIKALNRVALEAIDSAAKEPIELEKWSLNRGACITSCFPRTSISACEFYDGGKFYSSKFIRNLLREVFGRE